MYDQRPAGVALDQQDHLTIPHQRRKRSRHRRLRIAPGYHDDYIGAVDCGSEIARRALNRSEPTLLAINIHPAARSNLREPRIVNIVEPQLEPGGAQFGEEIDTTDSRSDYRNRLRDALVRRSFLLAPSLIPDIRRKALQLPTLALAGSPSSPRRLRRWRCRDHWGATCARPLLSYL